MTKVRVPDQAAITPKADAEAPTARTVREANTPVTLTDARGRQISIRRLGTLDQMRLLELVGADNSKNEQYLGLAGLAYSTVSIDGEPCSRLVNKLQLEARVAQLDDDGMAAVAVATVEHFGNVSAEELENIKKGLRTPG